ncbi:MAG: hypothetical protein ACE5JN_05075 [Candidatus Methylomirabilia bacterium]
MAAILLAAPGLAVAQVAGVRLTGRIDSNVSMDTLRVGDESFRTLSWGSRYAPSLGGYILDPRILLFSFGGSFADQRTQFEGGESRSLTLEPYLLNLSILPESTHSFGLLASRSISDFSFDRSEISITTDRLGANWNYRGVGPLPETFVDLRRESVESEFFTGLSEVTRSTLLLRLRKPFERFQPTLNYTGELTEVGGTVDALPEEGVSHLLRYDDRIRVGERGILTPLFEYEARPGIQSGSGDLRLTGPLSPTLDGSTGLRYAFVQSGDVTTHTSAGNGQITKRFTPDLVLTSSVNGALVAGGGPETWSGGGGMGLSAAPFDHLRTASDYSLQVSGGGRETTVSQRGNLQAVSTILPRHTLSANYSLALTEVGGAQPSFTSHSGALGVVSLLVPLTTLTGTYALELHEGAGERERHSFRLAAEVIPHPSLTARGSGEYFTEESTGGGRTALDETGFLAEASVAVRALGWLVLSLTGRQGVKEATREDRSGRFLVQSLTATASATLGTLLFHGEGFVERDQDIQQNREGVRGNLSYRFRVWSLSADFEVSELNTLGVEIGRQRFAFRLSRPLDFTLY